MSDNVKLRTAAETVGTMNTEGPLTVLPSFQVDLLAALRHAFRAGGYAERRDPGHYTFERWLADNPQYGCEIARKAVRK